MIPPGKMTFLIVDDVDTMRHSIRSMLKLINYGRHFLEANNGVEALKVLEKANPPVDIIISDYFMPKMTGTELLNRIRENQKLREIPFLMITAEANMEVVAEAAEHDVDAYMTKPFVTASLEQKINELLAKAANPGQTTLQLRKAKILEEQGDLDAAIQAIKVIITSDTSSSRPFREIGRLFFKKGNLQNALVFFKKATSLNRLDVYSYHYLGQIYYELGETDKAISSYSNALTISPRNAERALNFARLIIKQNQITEAEKVIKLVLKINSNDLDMREKLIAFCAENGLHDMAAKASRELLKIAPERVQIAKHLGISLFHQAQLPEAMKTLEQAALEIETDIDLWLTLAKTYLAMNKIVRAEKWATRVIRMDSDNEEAKEILDKCL